MFFQTSFPTYIRLFGNSLSGGEAAGPVARIVLNLVVPESGRLSEVPLELGGPVGILPDATCHVKCLPLTVLVVGADTAVGKPVNKMGTIDKWNE